MVVGWLLLGTQLAACGVAGHSLRRRLAPSWRGPWAVLGASVAAVAVLVVTGQVLGTVGLLRRWVLPPVLVVVAWALRPRGAAADPAHPAEPAYPTPPTPPTTQERPSPPLVRVVHVAALVATAAVAASWVERVVAVYRRGMTDGDSLMYHLVFAARFVQSGWTTGADPVGPDAWVAFYPANVELLAAELILPFGSDVLVPLMSLGWLALALAASWCIGAEVDRGPLGLLVGALVASVSVLVATQAGTARVDIAILGLLLAAVALVLHQPASAGSCALAGLALGLAVGSKFGVLPVAGLLAVGVALVLARRLGARAVLAWSGATVAAGAYWYVRNWVIAGSPVPPIDLRLFGIGFAPLPSDRRALLEGSSLVDAVERPGFWGNIARPVAAHIFGPPVITVAVAVAAVVVIVRIVGQRPLGLRHAVLLAGVGGCIAYPLAPYSAPLLDVDTHTPLASLIVTLNVRYLLPSLAVVLCLLPSALGKLDRLAAGVTVAASVAVAYLWFENTGFEAEWPTTRSDSVLGVVLVAAVVIVAFAAAAVARGRGRDRGRGEDTGARRLPVVPAALGIAGAVAVAAVGVTAWVAGGRSGVDRYDDLPPGHAALWAAAEDVPARDVALLDDWVQYPLMGEELGREVDYIGLPRDQGLTEPPRTCAEVEAALDAGTYDLVVVQRPIVTGPDRPDFVGCLRNGARAEPVLENESGAVFRLR